MSKNPFTVFRKPVVTEKSTLLRHMYADREHYANIVKYSFEVSPSATKDDIREAIEALFPEARGNILKVNTMRLMGKMRDPDKNTRRRRFRPGRTIARKKAIITLREGVTIARFEGI